MAKKLVKGIYRFFEFVLGFVIILILLLSIRLSKGPIDIKSLVEASVNKEDGIELTVKNAAVEFAFSRGRFMDVQIDELSLVNKDGFAVTVDKANVSFNPFWLLLGRFAPRTVEVEKPYIHLNLANSKSEQPQTQEKDDKKTVCRQLNKLRRYIEQLETLSITQGEVALNVREDASVLLQNLEVSLDHPESNKIQISTGGKISFKDVSTQWNLTADYGLNDKILLFKSSVDDIDLSNFQSIVPDLKGIDFVLKAEVDGKLKLNLLKTGWQKVFDNLSFKITTQKESSLHLPEPLDTTYKIQNAVIKGTVSSEFAQLKLADSSVKVLDKDISIDGDVSGLADFINSQDFSKLQISLNASVDDIPLKEVPNLWPAYLGTDAHDWIKDNITAGDIKKATFSMKMTGDEINSLISVLDIQGATIRYVEEMKPAKNAQAVVTLDEKSAKIKVISGEVEKVKITGGYVNFLDLDKDIPIFDMDIEFKGKVQDGLAIVSTEPLKICDDFPVPCKSIKGNATGHVLLNFSFVDENIEDTMKYSVSADLEDLNLPVPETEWKVSDGYLKLFVNNDKLTLKGKGLLDEKPMNLDIVNSFDDKDSLYQISLPVTASMIAPYFDRIDNFLNGSLLTLITIKPISDKEMTVGLEFGLRDAEISLPIGYVKEFNKKGTLKATLSLINEKLVSIPSIYLSMPDENILIKGKIDLPKDKLFEVNLTEVKAPRTDASVIFSYYKNDNFDAKIKGKTADLSDLLHGDFFSVRQVAEEKHEKEEKSEKVQDFSVDAVVDTLYLARDKEPFKDVSVKVVKKGGHWEKIDGSLKGNSPLKFSLNEEKKALKIQTDDVGDVLDRAGLTNRIKGGKLNSTLSQEKDGSLKGTIKVKKYELTETDFFMQAATLLGIVDAVRGDTISFDKALIPFTLTPSHAVKIEDAVAFGTAVGITMSGTVDSEKIDLSGSVAPAYALNSLPGKIPVVGSLLSGEEGGGLFGVSYSIKGKTEKPETSFNPASLLTPGIFRKIFEVF